MPGADVLVSDPDTTAVLAVRGQGDATGSFCIEMHTSSTLVLVLAVFAASLVEMVEALTIVVAAGVSRGWRPALEGAAAALLLLGVLVLAVGIPLIRYIPIDTLRVVVGALLLVLGLSWLRKAILRASGHKDPHDEDKIFAATVAELAAEGAAEGAAAATPVGAAACVAEGIAEGAPVDATGPAVPTTRRHDGVGFAVAFKGVFLEGTEVVLIVISLGAAQHRLGLAALAAAAAAVLVAIVGLVVARQLSEVPENTIKTVVGVMLTSFGVFWVGEGAGVHWPGSDLAIPVLVGFFVVVFFAFTAFMRTLLPAAFATPGAAVPEKAVPEKAAPEKTASETAAPDTAAPEKATS